MQSMTLRSFFLSFAVFAAASGSARAQHAGDIALGLAENRIRTGVIEGEAFAPGTRVFASELGELVPNFTDEPGFDNLPGTFPVPSTITFTINKALRAWDGNNFDTIPMERVSVGFGPLAPVLTPLTDVSTPGFTLAVGSNGEWHRHLEYTLAAPAADGVYLLELTLQGSLPTMQTSEPFWIVFNQHRTEVEHDAAIAWVRLHLAGGGLVCDAIDFNRDGVSPDSLDIADFLSVFGGGACSNDPPTGTGCGDVDFNNDGVSPDSADIEAFLRVFAGGTCE